MRMFIAICHIVCNDLDYLSKDVKTMALTALGS